MLFLSSLFFSVSQSFTIIFLKFLKGLSLFLYIAEVFPAGLSEDKLLFLAIQDRRVCLAVFALPLQRQARSFVYFLRSLKAFDHPGDL